MILVSVENYAQQAHYQPLSSFFARFIAQT